MFNAKRKVFDQFNIFEADYTYRTGQTGS